MSEYIYLILYEYIDRRREGNEFKEKDYINAIKQNKLPFIFIGLTAISLGIFYYLLYIDNKYFISMGAITFICLLSLISAGDKNAELVHRNDKKIYDKELNLIRDILYEYKVYDMKKLEKLIEQCELNRIDCKYSKKISDKISKVGQSVFLPFFTFASGLIVKNVTITLDESIKWITMIISFVVIVIIFLYYILLILEGFLDNKSSKLKSFKGKLTDILIIDFIKKESTKSRKY